jgi:hypothetical protein
MMSSAGGGHHRHTAAARISPHEEAAIQFAGQVAHFLEAKKTQKKFEILTIAAEPPFLGKLKSAMTPKLLGAVVSWIDKDLLNVPYLRLPKFLKLKTAPLKIKIDKHPNRSQSPLLWSTSLKAKLREPRRATTDSKVAKVAYFQIAAYDSFSSRLMHFDPFRCPVYTSRRRSQTLPFFMDAILQL